MAESLELYWDRRDRLCVERRPEGQHLFWISAEFEKGHKDRILPMAPEFALLLEEQPDECKSGRVFQPVGIQGGKDTEADWVGRMVSGIGKKAGIEVNVDTKSGKVKFASAHDLRRAFGARWASRVTPAVLKELMRHADISTTLKYYVGHNAEGVNGTLWSAYAQASST